MTFQSAYSLVKAHNCKITHQKQEQDGQGTRPGGQAAAAGPHNGHLETFFLQLFPGTKVLASHFHVGQKSLF